MSKRTKNEKETIKFGKDLAKKFKGGEVLILQGDLGAGKTILTKGIAEGLGIKKNVTSPTYLLMKEYLIKNKNCKIKKLIHIDTYRGLDMREMEELGILESIGNKECVVVVEWGVGLENYLNKLKIKSQKIIIRSEGMNERIIEVE